MYEVQQTSVFVAWHKALRDRQARGRITARLLRLAMGNFGDAKTVGDGVHELRMTFGPGYRVYFTQRGERIILLLSGGDKSSQSRDIVQAKQIASELE
ncbi:MAG: type II toxin-antitoxin system RelE/ParE family toxin [Novosphingobium sp.]